MSETKYDLITTYSADYTEYQTLFNLYLAGTISTTGVLSWTSTSSGNVYSTTTGGQTAVMQQIKSTIHNYLWTASDANSIASSTQLGNIMIGSGLSIDSYGHLSTSNTTNPNYGVDTGTVNTYVITFNPVPTSYVDGMLVAIKISHTSTGASTLNVNGLGAKTISDSYGNVIVSGELIAGIIYSMRYNATTGDFILQSGGSSNSVLNPVWDAINLTVGSGTLTTDSLCWLGSNIQYTQPASSMALVTVASVSYNLLRYGQYSVGFRLKSSNITSATAVTTLKVLNSSGNVVNSVGILGTNFAIVGANVYNTFYLPFNNSGQSTGNVFTFEFTSEAVASTLIAIDSIIVAPMQLAQYG
jgi:hypothetical protein